MLLNISFLLLGAFGISLGIRLFNRHFSTSDWPMAEGKLLRKRINRHAINKNKTHYSLNAEYEYCIEGKRFHSKTIFELELKKRQRLLNKEQAYNALGLLAPVLQVYYNPENPQESFLYRRALTAPIFSISTGLLLILIASVKILVEF